MAVKKDRDRLALLHLGRIGNEEAREIGRARIDRLAEDRLGVTTGDGRLALSWIRVGRLPGHSRAKSNQLGYNRRTSRRPHLTLGASMHRVRA